MSSIVDSVVSIQTSSQSVPSTPSWLGEVTLIAHYLRRQEVLSALEEHVRFARPRFGHFEVIDFVAVLLGYAISGERTIEAFSERLQPFANAFMAVFGRERLPHRSTLSRYLSSLDHAPVEALRALFLKDLLARPLVKEGPPGGLWGREGSWWLVARCRRHAASRPSKGVAPDVRSTASTASAQQGLCSGIVFHANGARSRGRAPPFCKPIPTNGSPRLGERATVTTGVSCAVRWK